MVDERSMESARARRYQGRKRKKTNRSFVQPEIRVDEGSKADDLSSFLEVEEEKREFLVELRGKSVVVADLEERQEGRDASVQVSKRIETREISEKKQETHHHIGLWKHPSHLSELAKVSFPSLDLTPSLQSPQSPPPLRFCDLTSRQSSRTAELLAPVRSTADLESDLKNAVGYA